MNRCPVDEDGDEDAPFGNVPVWSHPQMDSGRGGALCLPVGVVENTEVLVPPSGWR